jgi:adenylate kinase
MKLILTTGISGVGEKEYLNNWIEYCRIRGKKVKVFNAGEMMLKHAHNCGIRLQKRNILNADKDLLQMDRSVVFTTIFADISANSENYDAVIICMHSFMFWKERFYRTYDRFLERFLKRFPADMYITFIDDFRKIFNRLSQREEWQTNKTKLTYSKILYWQNIEVEVTSGWADFADRPFFALATGQPISTLYKLVFHPEIETVYVKMPISHFREPEKRVIVDNFIKELDRPFTVFSPLAVELVGAMPIDKINDEETITINNHIVHRDLYWFVNQCDIGVTLWPGIVPSPGVDHETHESHTKTKNEWVIFLGGEVSPFMAYFNTEFFPSIEAFFEFVYKKYPERKNLEW